MSERSVNYERKIISRNDEKSSFERYMEDYLSERGLSGVMTNREIDLQFIANEFMRAYNANKGKDLENMTISEMEDDQDINDFLRYVVFQLEDAVCDWSVHPIYTWIRSRFNDDDAHLILF